VKTLEDITTELNALLKTKEQAYGQAFAIAPKILTLLYPEGVLPEDYENLLTITRILDKINRIANNDKSEDAWQDIAGYCLLAIRKRTRE
jgi:hypothetical protein